MHHASMCGASFRTHGQSVLTLRGTFFQLLWQPRFHNRGRVCTRHHLPLPMCAGLPSQQRHHPQGYQARKPFAQRTRGAQSELREEGVGLGREEFAAEAVITALLCTHFCPGLASSGSAAMVVQPWSCSHGHASITHGHSRPLLSLAHGHRWLTLGCVSAWLRRGRSHVWAPWTTWPLRWWCAPTNTHPGTTRWGGAPAA